MRRRFAFAALLGTASACASAADPTAVRAQEVASRAATPVPESSDPASDPEPTSDDPVYGEQVEMTATYAVAPVRGSKRLQGGYLVVDGVGETWTISYRLDPALFEFVDKRVVVTGRPYTNSPNVQSVRGTHFELTSIRLAPDETPYPDTPTKLPAPPRAVDEAALKLRVSRWAHVIGRLQLPAVDDNENWPEGTLALEGSESVVRVRGLESRLRPFDGQQVTVLGQVSEGDGLVVNIAKVCAGDVAECEVDREP